MIPDDALERKVLLIRCSKAAFLYRDCRALR